MKALCWQGVNKLGVETVDDPQIRNAEDLILKVSLSTVCGSDLHLLSGYIPFHGVRLELVADVRYASSPVC